MRRKPFDGERVRDYLNAESESLLARYRQFEALLPAKAAKAGSAHPGEDGRFVESLVRTYLSELLPRSLEVASGFILRPAVKTGVRGEERRGEKDQHSRQLDILVHDSANYPVFQRFAGNVVVPPEGVVAIISIKKTLRDGEIASECEALREAARLCRCLDRSRQKVRGPYLALVGMTSAIDKKTSSAPRWIFQTLASLYEKERSIPTFDELVGYIGALDQFSVFKARPPEQAEPTMGRYVSIAHTDGAHWALQFILTGILSVFFDTTRSVRRRPGFSSFPSGRPHEETLGEIPVGGFR